MTHDIDALADTATLFEGSYVTVFPSADSNAHATVIVVTCPAIREHQAGIIGALIADAVRIHGGQLVIDVSGVTNFASAWINELMSATRRSRAAGGELIIVGFDRSSQHMLRATGLTKYLSLDDNRENAIARLAPSTPPIKHAA